MDAEFLTDYLTSQIECLYTGWRQIVLLTSWMQMKHLNKME